MGLTITASMDLFYGTSEVCAMFIRVARNRRREERFGLLRDFPFGESQSFRVEKHQENRIRGLYTCSLQKLITTSFSGLKIAWYNAVIWHLLLLET